MAKYILIHNKKKFNSFEELLNFAAKYLFWFKDNIGVWNISKNKFWLYDKVNLSTQVYQGKKIK